MYYVEISGHVKSPDAKALASDLVVEGGLVQTGLRMKYSITKSPVSSNIPPTSSATRICLSRHGHLKKENLTGIGFKI